VTRIVDIGSDDATILASIAVQIDGFSLIILGYMNDNDPSTNFIGIVRTAKFYSFIHYAFFT